MPLGIYPRTKEHCRKISEARKREWDSGKRTMKMSFKGFHHSTQSRLRISKNLKNNPKRSKFVFKKGLIPWNKGMDGFLGGKKHYNWQGGKSFEPYPIKWTRKLRNIIRKRDKYTCQVCYKKQKKRIFCVHHIDYNKENCNPLNLITLCLSCHIKTNFNRKRWRNYFERRYTYELK